MALELLFPHFDALVRTLEDVQRLNEAILQLAVQGKLVPQDPNDEPAEELLKRIEAEKKWLVQEKKIGKSKPMTSIRQRETSFELPNGWCWARLGDVILEIQTGPFGSTLHKSDYVEGGVPVVNPANIRNGRIEPLANMAVSEDTKKRLDRYVLEKGDIVMARRGEMGRCAVVTEKEAGWLCGSGSFNLKTSSNMSQDYLVRLIRSPEARQYLSGGSVGSTMNNLNHRVLGRIVMGVPPRAEQLRIVAKVDELFAQTRALEARLRQAQADVVTANRAALHRLHTAQDDDQFQAAWRTLRDHFDVLYDDPRTVAELRQAILDLAVRGKLAAQDPEDEPAEELVRQVGQTRLSVSQNGSQTIPFKTPDPWEWTRLGDLAEVVSGVTLGRNLQGYTTVTLPYLRVANVQRGYLDLTEIKQVEVKVEETEKYLLREGDLLLTEGGDADKLGRAAIWRSQIPVCIHQNHIFRARPLGAASAEWLMLCINSPYGREYFLGSSKKTTNLATINSTQLKNCPVPLPPFAEQRRILAKVNQLMRLCDALEAGLAQAETARRRATAATLSQA